MDRFHHAPGEFSHQNDEKLTYINHPHFPDITMVHSKIGDRGVLVDFHILSNPHFPDNTHFSDMYVSIFLQISQLL